MNKLFKCRDCGAPLSTITSFCPECGSTGPHIPIGMKKTRPPLLERRAQRKQEPDKQSTRWWDEAEPEPGTRLKRPKPQKREPAFEESREKERAVKQRPDRKHVITAGKEDDRDMRNEWAGSSKPQPEPLGKRTWGYIIGSAAVFMVILLVVFNLGAIGDLFRNLTATRPPVTASTVPGTSSSSQAQQNIPSNSGQAPSQTPADKPAAPAVAPAAPEPAKDTTRPGLVGNPEVGAGDITATITWKTDESASSFVRYGTDTSYPFPSTEDTHRTTSHNIYLSGLTPDTLYHYQVISADASGNTLTSADYTFRTQSRTNAAPYPGSTAPDFSLHTLDGKMVTLSQFRGKKVILNFWASWCTPCKIELPHIQAVCDKYSGGSDVVVLTVAGSQSDEAALQSYVRSNAFTFPVLLDSSEMAFNTYEIVSIPKTYFIDKGGVIRRVQQGMFTSPGEVEFMLNSY